MPNSIKVVLDLNLFVSALIGRPATAPLLEHWRDQRYILVTSQVLLVQLLAVLARPKFVKYFSDDETRILKELIEERAEIVEPTIQLILCRDAKDNILLEVAATARANYLATGDKDLLDDPVLISKMREEYGVEIVTASRLLEILTNEMS